MVEKPSENAPVDRLPLDVYDPTADGYTAHTLEEVVAIGYETAEEITESIERFTDALRGCMTPLNFSRLVDDLDGHARSIKDLVRGVGYARSIVEEGRPLARVLSPNDRPWTGPQGLESALSPKQLLRARRLVREVGVEDITTYREAVLGASDPVPWHAARERKRRAENDLSAKLLANMLAQVCTKCGASVGEYCLTATGRRADIPHAARRDSSPLMKDHPSLYLSVKQPLEWAGALDRR